MKLRRTWLDVSCSAWVLFGFGEMVFDWPDSLIWLHWVIGLSALMALWINARTK